MVSFLFSQKTFAGHSVSNAALQKPQIVSCSHCNLDSLLLPGVSFKNGENDRSMLVAGTIQLLPITRQKTSALLTFQVCRCPKGQVQKDGAHPCSTLDSIAKDTLHIDVSVFIKPYCSESMLIFRH